MRIVYLHGFASGPGSKKAAYFRQRFSEQGIELEVPDLTGGDFEHLTISGQLRILEETARGEPVRLIGSSLGGYTSALYAAHHPEVDSLILMAPAFNFLERWRQRLGPETMESWKNSDGLPIQSYVDGEIRRLHYGFMQDGEKYEPFPDFHQPAIVFHGRADDIVPPEYSIDFARRHPNVELHLVDSNHELLNVLDHIWNAIPS